jgi:hypothetical protein
LFAITKTIPEELREPQTEQSEIFPARETFGDEDEEPDQEIHLLLDRMNPSNKSLIRISKDCRSDVQSSKRDASLARIESVVPTAMAAPNELLKSSDHTLEPSQDELVSRIQSGETAPILKEEGLLGNKRREQDVVPDESLLEERNHVKRGLEESKLVVRDSDQDAKMKAAQQRAQFSSKDELGDTASPNHHAQSFTHMLPSDLDLNEHFKIPERQVETTTQVLVGQARHAEALKIHREVLESWLKSDRLSDEWSDARSPSKRRKIQNKLAQRRFRK